MAFSTKHPVELDAPDITAFKTGNAGIDYVHTFAAEKDGPHVLVNVLTHGNELCGAWAALDLLRRGVRPRSGKLTICFANYKAYSNFDRVNPTASRFVDEDLNRVWAKLDTSDEPTWEQRRARELVPLFSEVDFLLDIHSLQTDVAPLALVGMSRKSLALARRMGSPETLIRDAGHRNGKRLLEFANFGNEGMPQTAVIVECGQHWKKASATTAIDLTDRFLLATGVIDAQSPREADKPQRLVAVDAAVTMETADFRFTEDFAGYEVIGKEGTIIAYDGNEPVKTPFPNCVLVMPTLRRVPGQTAVRLGRYVTLPPHGQATPHSIG